MELLDLFRWLVPLFASTSDEEVGQAFELASPYRPACLTAAEQDRAQVYYAAGLLYQRWMQTQSLASPLPFGVKSEKEGDLQRTYGSTELTADPHGFWKNYEALARLCAGTGAITVGHRHVQCCGSVY